MSKTSGDTTLASLVEFQETDWKGDDLVTNSSVISQDRVYSQSDHSVSLCGGIFRQLKAIIAIVEASYP